MSEAASAPIEERRTSKGRRAVDAALLATMLLTAVDHSPARALEIPPGTGWNQGIQGKIREGVTKDKEESSFVYLQATNGERWINTTKHSEARHATFDVNKLARQITSDPNFKETKNICIGHSHPEEVMKGLTNVENDLYKRMAVPPSLPDGKGGSGDSQVARQSIDFLTSHGVPKEMISFFEADHYGVWYYRPAIGSDYRNAKERDTAAHTVNTEAAFDAWKKDYAAFVGKSTIPGINLTGTAEYRRLVDSYRVNGETVVRFVPYDQVGNEPACAGVDYKAGKAIAAPASAAPAAPEAVHPIKPISPKPPEKTPDGVTTIDLSHSQQTIRLPE